MDLGTLLSEVYKTKNLLIDLWCEWRSVKKLKLTELNMVWLDAGERKVGVVLDEDSIQMYTSRRYGYAPFGSPDTVNNKTSLICKIPLSFSWIINGMTSICQYMSFYPIQMDKP